MASRDLLLPSVVILAASCIFLVAWNRRRRFPLPPGPSFRDLDSQALKDQPWRVFREWSQKYGPLMSWSIMGKTTVVITTADMAMELLERRSAVYSDRPLNWMAGHLAGRKDSPFTTSIQSPRFKMYRRLMHAGLNPKVAKDYRPLQVQELHTLMKDLQKSPERFRDSVKRNACAIILKVAYGYQMGGYDDEFVRIIEEVFKEVATLTTLGRWWVEYFPWLRFVPAWLPGAEFKRYALASREKLKRIDRRPFDWAVEQIASGKHIESFASKQLAEDTPYIPIEEKDDVVKWACSALYAGGGDTTVSALTTFFYVMQCWPEAQRRAQKEIDDVIGTNRLPHFDDYDSLPYVRALIKEVLRWGPVAPLAIPHCVTRDDTYMGYLIPKGSKVLVNIWAIMHDETLYPNPSEFDPERHLGGNHQTDPYKFAFGFGRRMCPGMHLGEMSLFLNISNILAAFTISKEVDANGKEIEPPAKWTTGLTS